MKKIIILLGITSLIQASDADFKKNHSRQESFSTSSQNLSNDSVVSDDSKAVQDTTALKPLITIINKDSSSKSLLSKLTSPVVSLLSYFKTSKEPVVQKVTSVQDLKTIIQALIKKYPGMSFEQIDDYTLRVMSLYYRKNEQWTDCKDRQKRVSLLRDKDDAHIVCGDCNFCQGKTRKYPEQTMIFEEGSGKIEFVWDAAQAPYEECDEHGSRFLYYLDLKLAGDSLAVEYDKRTNFGANLPGLDQPCVSGQSREVITSDKIAKTLRDIIKHDLNPDSFKNGD